MTITITERLHRTPDGSPGLPQPIWDALKHDTAALTLYIWLQSRPEGWEGSGGAHELAQEAGLRVNMVRRAITGLRSAGLYQVVKARYPDGQFVTICRVTASPHPVADTDTPAP